MKHINTRGFSIVEVAIVVVVIVMIAGLGYAFFSRKDQPLASNSDTDSTSQKTDSSKSTQEVTAITSSDDFDKIAKELDQLDLDEKSDDTSLSSSMSDL